MNKADRIATFESGSTHAMTLSAVDLDAKMHSKGVDAVVARMNLQYKVPLQCDDEFFSRLWLEKQGVRYVFHQDIFRASDEKLCLKATVELVCLINGRLGNSEEYDKAFEKFLK